MKVNLDDPNLTAFALGELSPDEHARVAQAIADSPEAQSYVAETQQFARLLRAEYEADRQQPANPEKLWRFSAAARIQEDRRASSRYQWGSLAAALAIFAVLGALAISTLKREVAPAIADNPKPSSHKESRPEATVEAVPEPSVEMDVAQQPVQPAATAAPPTVNEFREETRSAGRDQAAGKNRALALNPSAPPPPAPMPMKG